MTIELQKEPLISFIVPVYNIPPEVLKRCLMSLSDQDYPNMEVVIVFDGVNAELLNMASRYVESCKNWKLIEIPHGGACAARNAGFKVSTGEIVSFFNSDYIAKPGMVRMWVDAMLAHPECGFVYGGYEYSTAIRNAYPSKEFDEWDLTQANYIDCGFPLWRKYVVEWDNDCKSLQDWDFWIRVVKTHGVKGHYLGREYSFVASPPRPGGLSNDSHDNWIERVKYIKDKNDILMSDMVVTSVGAPYHGREIAKMIGADWRDQTILKPHDYKALYMIGWYMKPTDQRNEHPLIMANFPDSVKILHFVGADIYWLRKFNYEQLRLMTTVLNAKCDHILCETEMAQSELEAYGIKSDVLPIPPYQDYELKPLPKDFKVAVFLTNKSDFDKYCQSLTLSIVRAMPDVQFSAYGDFDPDDAKYPNLKHYGNLDKDAWKQFVYDHSCYLRLVRHDTRPMASDEFILAGRDVVTNVPMPYMRGIDTGGDISKCEIDPFQIGLNAYYWPKTKKKVIQAIREAKEIPNQRLMNAEIRSATQAEMARAEYLDLLDRDQFKFAIHSLSKKRKALVMAKPKGEFAHV